MPNYYEINEEAARRAKEVNSFSDYKTGSLTAEYRQCVDEAREIAERQKARVDPMYHERIDYLVEKYAKKLAANLNDRSHIDARVPSVLIAGPAKFPVRKKEKQNAARDRNMEEWRYIQGLLHKIKTTGTGGISSADPNAITKLEIKLEGLETDQLWMKEVNAYYRKHKTLEGCPGLPEDRRRKMEADMHRFHHCQPFPTWALSNNNANIKTVRDRIKELEALAAVDLEDIHFTGGYLTDNPDAGRVQIFFDGKPDEEIRAVVKKNGFKWAPSQGAWQRIRTANALAVGKAVVEEIQKIENARTGGNQSQA